MRCHLAICYPAMVMLAIGALTRPVSAQVTSVRAKLATKIDLEKGIAPNTPLQDALDFLAERGKIKLRIDEEGFKQIGVQRPQEFPVIFPSMKAATVGLVLEVIMYQIAGDRFRGNFVVRKDHVLLVPGSDPYAKEIDREERATPLRITLARGITLKNGIAADTALTEALAQLQAQSKVPILVGAVGAREKVAKSPVKLGRQASVPLGTVLQQLLNQVKAGDAKLSYRVHRYWVEVYQK